MEPDGQPTEELPVDTRPDIHQVLGAVAPVSGPLASISKEADVVNAVAPQVMETGPETRPREPGSEPGSEPGERNDRPRVGSESNEHRMDGDEEWQPSTATEGDVLQGAAGEPPRTRERSVRCTIDQSLANLVVHANIRQHLRESSPM